MSRPGAIRFGNVVGPRQTHGVGFDFVRRLLADPTRLRILGDGRQSKSYVHVDDVIAAVMVGAEVDGAIRGVQRRHRGLHNRHGDRRDGRRGGRAAGRETKFEYTGGDRGWKGDVPIVRLNSERIRSLGWKNERTWREALRDSMAAMLVDARAGRFDA